VHIWLLFADLAPLYLGPHHKGVHWSFDVIGIILLRLKREKLAKYYNLSNKRIKKDYTIQQITCKTVLKSLLMHHGSPEAYTYRKQYAHRMLT